MEPAIPSPNPKANTLHSLIIYLGSAGQGTLPTYTGRAVHAQVLNWFRSGDTNLSQAIHDSQQSPLSLSDLLRKQPGARVKEGDEFQIRIGLLNGSLLHPLLKGLEAWGGQPFNLAEFPFVIKRIEALPGTHPWVQSSDYQYLANCRSISSTLTLRFFSPTNFKGNRGQGIQPIPLPDSVFGNLSRRWNGFAPKELQFPKIQWNGLISDFELKCQGFKLPNSTELGATGWVKYHFLDAEQARVATILANFAKFAGVGRNTATGMGQVRLVSH